MTILAWIGIVLAILFMGIGVLAALLGLPGTVLVVVMASCLSALTHWQRPPWWMLLVFLGMALLAETADNLLSAWGTRKYGGTAKAALWALIGGVAGALVGGYLGPLIGALFGPVGSLVGAILAPILCALAGGYLGGYWHELRLGKSKAGARRAGGGAFMGRAAGALLKAVFAAIITGLTIWLLFRGGGPFGG